jgi:TorA maturation chaperone TorD
MLIGDSTLDVRQRYAKEGLSINLKEAPDHIAIELEFMYFLIHKEVEAALVGDSDQAVDYISKQRDFLEVHLARWACDLTVLMAAKAETAFYRKLANVTRTFIEADVKNLSDIAPYALPAQRAGGKTVELPVRKER